MRTIKLFLLITISLFLLTGCVSADYKIKLNSGGSIDMTYKLLFQKTVLQLSMLGAEGVDPDANPVDVFFNTARDLGYDTERIIENEGVAESEMEGFIATKHAGSIEDIEFLAFDTSGDICRATKEEYTYDRGFFRNHYSIRLSLDRMPEVKPDDDYAGEDDGFTYAIMSGLDLKLTIDLPFKPEHTNSTTVENNGKRHIWVPEYYMITAVELDGYVLNYAVIIPIALILLALLALILMRIFRLSLKDVSGRIAALPSSICAVTRRLPACITSAFTKTRKKDVTEDVVEAAPFQDAVPSDEQVTK